MRTALAPLILVAAQALGADPPAAIAELLAGTTPRGQPTSWCKLSSGAGDADAYAVLMAAPPGGEYIVVRRGATLQRLASFQGPGELACHTPQQARELHRSIARSDTIRGAIRPRWTTPVVCGFTTDTTAVCWQLSPGRQRYVEVGGWST